MEKKSNLCTVSGMIFYPSACELPARNGEGSQGTESDGV